FERFALKPFFAGMDMEVKSKFIGFLAGIPMFLAAATILLGVWGIAQGGVNMENGVALLKSALLAFVVAVAVIVVAVPEGLPMMVTVSLALNMMKMARENCLVRRLVASETIGSATVVCTDKTGTLTENKMTPVHVFVEGADFTKDDFAALEKTAAWPRLVAGVAVNSQANLRFEGDSVAAIGNPTECALLQFLRERGVDYRAERGKATPSLEIGHNSARKFSAVAAETPEGGVCFVKGAPERVLARCATILVGGVEKPFAE
ncbi:MAG: HAD-IC family P-type ATPase, partial [Thermoguttaceae bacterium]|nr:HAD-IC family P-type ATPase [Thermoguttaceae bacterium]